MLDADALHADSTVFLGYVNPVFTCTEGGGIDFNPFTEGNRYVQGSLPNYRAGGVDVIVGSFSINYPSLFPGLAGVGRVTQQLGAFMAAVASHSDTVCIAREQGDVAALREAGRVAVILHLTCAFLDGRLEVLQAYRQLGVRSIHPSFDTQSQDRPHDWKTGAGLTAFGREVVLEMDQLGMVVDLAHASDRMAYDVLEMVDRPVIISHTMCRALVDSPRNTPDELLKAVAGSSGVVGLVFAGAIDERYARDISQTSFHEELRKWEEALHREFPDPHAFMANRLDYERWVQTEAYRISQTVAPPAFSKVLDHLEYLIETAGIDHVGLGTDYDLGNMPAEVATPANLSVFTRGLLERGYTEADIRKFLGGNFLRVFGER